MSKKSAKPTRYQSPGRLRALSVLAHMRQGRSLSQAARLEHTTVRTVKKQLGKQLRLDRSRRFRASRGDTLRRDLNLLGSDGFTATAVRSSKLAELASRHLTAVNKYLNSGDAALLKPFAGKFVNGIELLTDPDRIREFADAGLVKLDALYRRGGQAKA